MKIKNLLLLLSIVLFFIGCSKTKTSLEKMEIEDVRINQTKYYEDNPKYASYKFDIDIKLPKCNDDTTICQLRKTIIESIFNVNIDTTNLESTINLYMLEKADLFQEPGVSNLKNNNGTNQMWTNLKANFVYTDKNLCSYIINEEYFTGGAHSNKVKYYFVYDFSTGKKLDNEDIFIPNIKENLSLKKILLNQLMKQENAKQISELNLFDVESAKDFMISPIIYFDSANLVFAYGDYDIRAYAYGAPEIKIPISQAKIFLREDFKKRHFAE
ncbi:MAG: RsiV family protein [Bacteroidales bacterium]